MPASPATPNPARSAGVRQAIGTPAPASPATGAVLTPQTPELSQQPGRVMGVPWLFKVCSKQRESGTIGSGSNGGAPPAGAQNVVPMFSISPPQAPAMVQQAGSGAPSAFTSTAGHALAVQGGVSGLPPFPSIAGLPALPPEFPALLPLSPSTPPETSGCPSELVPEPVPPVAWPDPYVAPAEAPELAALVLPALPLPAPASTALPSLPQASAVAATTRQIPVYLEFRFIVIASEALGMALIACALATARVCVGGEKTDHDSRHAERSPEVRSARSVGCSVPIVGAKAEDCTDLCSVIRSEMPHAPGVLAYVP